MTERKSVLIGGTFEILHPGHIALIRFAQRYGKVIVVVARDTTVERVRGRKPIIPEEQRRYLISQIKGVSRAVLGEEGTDFLKIVEKIKPSVIVLGPDQPYDPAEMKAELEKRGMTIDVVKMTEPFLRYPLCKSSRIIDKIREVFCQ